MKINHTIQNKLKKYKIYYNSGNKINIDKKISHNKYRNIMVNNKNSWMEKKYNDFIKRYLDILIHFTNNFNTTINALLYAYDTYINVDRQNVYHKLFIIMVII